jgi:hypothetical protein
VEDVSFEVPVLLNKFLSQKDDEGVKECKFGASDENLEDIDDRDRQEEVPVDAPLGNMVVIIDTS